MLRVREELVLISLFSCEGLLGRVCVATEHDFGLINDGVVWLAFV